MNRINRLSLVCLLALGVVATARADAVDLFLEDVAFTQSGYGPTNAVEKIDARLAKGDLAAEDRARVLLKKIEILKGIEWDYAALASLVEEEFYRNRSLSPKTRLAGMEALMAGRNPAHKDGFEPVSIPFLQGLLSEEAVRKDDALAAAVNRKLAERQASRNFFDLAASCYAAAAQRLTDPTEKAEALLAAAMAARSYRDMESAGAYLDAIGKIEGLSFEIKKRALLIHGETAIYPDQHDWKPTKERIAEAKKYIDEAFADHSPLLGTDDASRVIGALVSAQAKGGDPAGAAAYGVSYLEGPVYSRNHGHQGRWRIADPTAAAFHQAGDYKSAIKYYELVGRSGCPFPKENHLRIANSARAKGDYLRAVQAYSDAIKLCNPVEGKAEIQYLTGQIKIMNKSVRKGSSSLDSEAIFSDTNEDIGGLTLEEE